MTGLARPTFGAIPAFTVLAFVVPALTGCEGGAPEPADAGAGAADTVVSAGPEGSGVARDTPSTDEPAAPVDPGDPADSTALPGGEDARPFAGYDTVFVYFTDVDEEQVPSARAVPGSLDGLRAAFTELLEGPTPAERAAGLRSWFSRETAGMLRGVRYEDGFAIVDFDDLRPVIPNAVGSAGALMLLGELQATAFQFPAVERVEFRIEGDCEALMAWLQFGCYPIRRGPWDPPPGFRTAVR